MGVDVEDTGNIEYIKEATAYQDIISATDKFTKEFKKEGHDYFRVVVASISTFITYSDVKATYGFLQKLTGRLGLIVANCESKCVGDDRLLIVRTGPPSSGLKRIGF